MSGQYVEESKRKALGMYHPRFEHDNCGIGAIVNIKGKKTHDTVKNALEIVAHLEHRAGKDGEGKTGDGVGIMLQISHKFFKKIATNRSCQILRVRLHAKTHDSEICFFLIGQQFTHFGRLSQTNRQYPGRIRIQRSRMPNLFLVQNATKFCYYIVGCITFFFIYIDNSVHASASVIFPDLTVFQYVLSGY